MFYCIDKPLWITSFDVIRRLRKTLGIKKMWHTWTLDPLASGCILIATENSTKLIPLIEWSDKTYTFTVAINGTSPSLDLGTTVTNYPQPQQFIERTPDELKAFLCNQTSQIPPKYSALHINGERAYTLARTDRDFSIPERPISITNVEILDFSPPFFDIRLRISSGWYIRSLAPIIGEFFGSYGGYITSLRRTIIHMASGDIGEDIAIPLDDIDKKNTIERQKIFPTIPTIQVDESTYKQLQEWRIIQSIPPWTIGAQYFLDFEDIYSSFVEYHADGYHIIRNNV